MLINNSFFIGAAGTGKQLFLKSKKSTTLKEDGSCSNRYCALNIGGTTINSAFRIGFDTIPVITKSKDPRFKNY